MTPLSHHQTYCHHMSNCRWHLFLSTKPIAITCQTADDTSFCGHSLCSLILRVLTYIPACLHSTHTRLFKIAFLNIKMIRAFSLIDAMIYIIKKCRLNSCSNWSIVTYFISHTFVFVFFQIPVVHHHAVLSKICSLVTVLSVQLIKANDTRSLFWVRGSCDWMG